MLALIGITIGINVLHIGLKLTSETAASAAYNAVPVITFFLAFLMRMETLKIRSSHGIAKAAGVTLCLAGVIVIAFYTGPAIHPLNHHRLFHDSSSQAKVNSKGTWIKGTFLLLFANTTWSLWLVMQGVILKEYPCKILLTTLQCVFSAPQSFVAAIAFERDFSKWKMGFDARLLGVVYCGLCNAGLACVIGGILTIAGLYCVLWGKNKEHKILYSTNEISKMQNVEQDVVVPIDESVTSNIALQKQ
ncbi:WAT1-related protein [Rhynchospora pubera]|uniref:WAT1-related protein n=1 Tax=Rhynchospora pubera TaxID=906938 RepID=A0AAV8GI76_9POAL|nr:WAT1-related protein [Rhynchospora pubera]